MCSDLPEQASGHGYPPAKTSADTRPTSSYQKSATHYNEISLLGHAPHGQAQVSAEASQGHPLENQDPGVAFTWALPRYNLGNPITYEISKSPPQLTAGFDLLLFL